MRALLLPAAGAFEPLRTGEVERPHPGPGEILIGVRAVGLDPVEYKAAHRLGEERRPAGGRHVRGKIVATI